LGIVVDATKYEVVKSILTEGGKKVAVVILLSLLGGCTRSRSHLGVIPGLAEEYNSASMVKMAQMAWRMT
jgi:hypothetical protein